jgi:hypothetical protein
VADALSRDLKDLLEILNKWGVEYLVVGGHALSVYTEPRATKDLDVWVNPTPENAKLAFAALKEYGAPLFGTSEEFFTERDTFLTIGVAPNRIDVLKSIDGVEFPECWATRKTFRIGDVEANFPSLEKLLAAKLAAGRPQDLVDASKLMKAIELERRERPNPDTEVR